MGGFAKTAEEVRSSTEEGAIIASMQSEFGDFVTKDWLASHGLTLQASTSDIQSIVDQEMVSLDEEWAINARKAQRKGKGSLLTGSETSRGSDTATTASLL